MEEYSAFQQAVDLDKMCNDNEKLHANLEKYRIAGIEEIKKKNLSKAKKYYQSFIQQAEIFFGSSNDGFIAPATVEQQRIKVENKKILFLGKHIYEQELQLNHKFQSVTRLISRFSERIAKLAKDLEYTVGRQNPEKFILDQASTVEQFKELKKAYGKYQDDKEKLFNRAFGQIEKLYDTFQKIKTEISNPLQFKHQTYPNQKSSSQSRALQILEEAKVLHQMNKQNTKAKKASWSQAKQRQEEMNYPQDLEPFSRTEQQFPNNWMMRRTIDLNRNLQIQRQQMTKGSRKQSSGQFQCENCMRGNGEIVECNLCSQDMQVNFKIQSNSPFKRGSSFSNIN